MPTLAPASMVRIDGGPRPEASTRVSVGEWEGPLGLLLSLIEARQLDILTVPLGALAESYLDALAALDGERLGHVSAFIGVASQLILIKSRAMLPRSDSAAPGIPLDDEADPEAELRARLLVYRAHRDAGLRLQEAARLSLGIFRREPAVARAAAVAGATPAAARPLAPATLVSALDGLVRLAVPPKPAPGVLARAITLSERASLIREALRSAPQVVLQELLRGVRDRVVVAVTFLAMLELMKRREIVVEQAAPWGPIVARAATAAERAAAGLPPTAAEEPFDESLASFS